jgi:hypothetical protein
MRTGAKKGQMSSIDAVLALIVFAGMVVFFMAFWSSSMMSIKGTLQKNRQEYAALAASGLLVKSPGVPYDWENAPSGVRTIGLAKSENVLSREKLSAFAGLPYGESKALLGIDSDFFFYLEDMEGSRLYEAGNPAASGKTSAIVARFALLDGKAVRIRLNVYG